MLIPRFLLPSFQCQNDDHNQDDEAGANHHSNYGSEDRDKRQIDFRDYRGVGCGGSGHRRRRDGGRRFGCGCNYGYGWEWLQLWVLDMMTTRLYERVYTCTRMRWLGRSCEHV